MTQSTVESKNKKDINNGKVPAKETILSPRFYTTDFEAMENNGKYGFIHKRGGIGSYM